MQPRQRSAARAAGPAAGAGRRPKLLPSWKDAAQIAAGFSNSIKAEDCYKIGEATLAVESADPALRRRLRVLFGDARIHAASSSPAIRCTIKSDASGRVHLIEFRDPHPPDLVAFVTAIFPERKYRAEPSPIAGWTLLRPSVGRESEVAVAADSVLARGRRGWQSFVGSLAIQRALRVQTGTLFFHAASIAAGTRGALLVGPKGSGKTTLSMALAARGCDFFGDELAGVRADLGLLPMRRAVSIRSGPRAAALESALRRIQPGVETLPDGTRRLRVRCSRLFPLPGSARLQSLLFLRGFSEQPRIIPFSFRLEHLAQLQLLPASLNELSVAGRIMRILTMFAQIRCAYVDLGKPDDTADRVARFLEDE